MSFSAWTTPGDKNRSQTLISVQLPEMGEKESSLEMLQIDCSDNPSADVNPVVLISNNKHRNQKANKAWNI